MASYNELILAELRKQSVLLESIAGKPDVPEPTEIQWGGDENIRLQVERATQTGEDMRRDGYFTATETTGRNLPRRTLRWTPGTERVFPTFDQMVVAKSTYRNATEWDFSALANDSHLFGIPLRFES